MNTDAPPTTTTDDKEPAVKTKKPARKKAAKAKTKSKTKSNGARAGSKTEVVSRLLQRQNGCTSADVLKATGWPTVSMPAMAKAAGLKLRKQKEKGSVTRYYGS